MERRQLEWGWQRQRRPERRARKPGREPSLPVDHPTLETGIEDLERLIHEVSRGRIGPLRKRRGHVIVTLRAQDDELYHLRIGTTGYPDQPPSCSFVDSRGRETSSAWPVSDHSGPFRAPSFICTPPIAEFYLHHGDRRYDAHDGTLVNTVCTIFAALNGRGYSGRYDQPRRGARNRRR